MKIPPYPPLTKGGWGDFHIKARKEKGFILVIVLSLLLLLAVTAMSLNFKTGMQARMAANRSADVQTYLDQLAVIENSFWKLTEDPTWRVPAGENYAYHGRTYSRRVFGPDTVTYAALANYADAVILSVQAPAATSTVKKSFRYYIDTPFMVRKPRQVVDIAGNIYFADTDNHSVWKIDALSGAIIRVAGTGTSGFSGDGGPATQAKLDNPTGVCVDAAGNVYVADTNNNRLRKVTMGGTITTVAGTGTTGYSGDGGPAINAQLGTPQGLALDSLGNLYIAQKAEHVIRKIALPSGIISRVAGTGSSGYSGEGGPAVDAKLSYPEAVFVDPLRNLYIADTSNHAIRKVDASTQNISTIAGLLNHAGFSGDGGPAVNADLTYPAGVYKDAAGDIFIADTDNCRIRKVAAATGIITTHAGTGVCDFAGDGGAATGAKINKPTGICGKTGGGLIIADTENSCLRRVDATISIVAQTAQRFALSAPGGVALYFCTPGSCPYVAADQGRQFLYIADTGNNRIWRLDTVTNAITPAAGTGSAGNTGDGGQAIDATLNSPAKVAVDPSGNLFIADTTNCCIRKIDSSGIITRVAGAIKSGGLPDCGSSGDGGAATATKLKLPSGVALDTAGNIYIADTNDHRIRKVTATTGIISTVVNTAGQQTNMANPKGDGGAATAATLNYPRGVTVDTVGDGAGDIYIADTGNHCIRKVTAATGIISTVAGTTTGYTGDGGLATAAKLTSPWGVSLDTAGNLYVSDTGNHALRLVNNPGAAINPGVISTVAGIATGGYNGDNQPAVQAQLNSPAGAALGLAKGGGRIFISDSANNRIRMLFLKTVKEIYGP